MPEAYIVDAVRTAVGKRGGGFAAEHPADMAAHVIRTVVDRHDIDPASIDDVTCAVWLTSAHRPATSRAPPRWRPGYRNPCQVSRSTVSAGLRSRQCISRLKP